MKLGTLECEIVNVAKFNIIFIIKLDSKAVRTLNFG